MGCRCCSNVSRNKPAGPGVLGFTIRGVLLYLVAVFAGGTLMHADNASANEVGRILNLVTFVDPAIDWAEDNDHDRLAGMLQTVANGWPIGEDCDAFGHCNAQATSCQPSRRSSCD